MKAKIHVNNEFFLYLELHKMANKNHHYRSRETAEERKKFYIIVTLTVLFFFLLFEQGPPHFNFCTESSKLCSHLCPILSTIQSGTQTENDLEHS